MPKPSKGLSSYATYTDEELLKEISNDNQHAFAELFKRYWKKAYLLASSKLKSKELGEEIVQDLFIGLWDKRHKLNIIDFDAYIYVCVKNKFLNYIESKLVQDRLWLQYKVFVPKTETLNLTVEYDDLLDAIEAGMGDLPEKSRRVFQLNRIEGRSIKEIATLLNLSEKAIEYHLTRSLKTLRLHLKDYIISFVLTVTYLCGQ